MKAEEERVISTARRLFADGYITAEQLSRLKYDLTGITNDIDFPVDICDNGDVSIRECGAYPYKIPHYAEPLA